MSVPVRGSCWKRNERKWSIFWLINVHFYNTTGIIKNDKSLKWPYWAVTGSRCTVLRICHALRFGIYGKDRANPQICLWLIFALHLGTLSTVLMASCLPRLTISGSAISQINKWWVFELLLGSNNDFCWVVQEWLLDKHMRLFNDDNILLIQ